MRQQEQLKRILQDYEEIQRQYLAGELPDAERMQLIRELPFKYQSFWERLFQI